MEPHPQIASNNRAMLPSLPRDAPTFYLTARQPLRPTVILLGILTAAASLGLILYALAQPGQFHIVPGGTNASQAASGASGNDDDDPNQVDTIVLGDPSDAPVPARRGNHVSPVHPTILIVLPRSGEHFGQIPDTSAGRLLYDWLAAFNQANAPSLARALPTVAPASELEAEMELRRQTGGFTLLSAKEVQPGLLVFRLRDQTPAGNEVLGTLLVSPDAVPTRIASFSLRAVPTSQLSSATFSTTAAASN